MKETQKDCWSTVCGALDGGATLLSTCYVLLLCLTLQPATAQQHEEVSSVRREVLLVSQPTAHQQTAAICHLSPLSTSKLG